MDTNYQLLIAKLDAFIRKYYLNKLLRGILLFLSISLGLYLFISLSEYQLYFSSAARKAWLLLFSASLLFSGWRWLLGPLLHYLQLGKQISHEQAATIIGNHFSDVKDKLLNILQLQQQSQNAYNRDLIEASIHQKTESLKLVPFTSAIQLKENQKYLKYALPPLAVIVLLLIIAPQILKESSTRLLHPDKIYAKKAPFEFVLKNKTLKLLQFEDIQIQLQIEGKTVPNEVFIREGGRSYKMEKIAADRFSYRFTNIQKNIPFCFSANEFNSNTYTIEVFKKPILANFITQLSYPSYTGRKQEQIKNTGDLIVPVGTLIEWNFQTSGTDNVKIVMDGQSYTAEKKGAENFSFSKRILKDEQYTLFVSNYEVAIGDSISFTIQATPDNFPAIYAEQIKDSIQKDFAILLGTASDDYGLNKLEFHYTIKDEKGTVLENKKQLIPLNNKSATDFNQQLDFRKYNIRPGDRMEYYFEVWDNDAIKGSKSTKSQLYAYEMPSIQKLEQQELENNESIKDDLSAASKDARQLASQIKAMKEKILSKNSLSWEDKKQLEKIKQQHDELAEELKQIKEKYDENLKNQLDYKKPDEEILEKQEKLQEMMQDMLGDEMKDLMKQIEELLQKMDKKNAFQNLDKMEISNKDLKSELDKMEKLFKQLQMEQKAQETIDQLNELSKKQEKLSETTKQNEAAKEDLQQQQELNKKFDAIQENVKQLEKLSKENDNKLDTKGNNQASEDIQESMEKSSKELEKKENDKAYKSQKSSAQKMQKMAQKMKNDLDKMQMDQNAEDIQMIRQLLENLVKLSFDQEKLIKELKETETESPKYIQIMQKQFDLRDDAKLIADSLQSLGKRQFQIQTFISDEMYKLNREMKKALDNLEARNKYTTGVAQQLVMTSTNNLALMLSESLDNLQQMQKQKKPGSGSCSKPGGKGEKPSMSELQKKLGEQLGKMKEAMQQGKDPKQMGKDFAEAVQKQAAIREALRQMKEKMSQEEKNGSGVEDMMKKMDDLEKELAIKRLSPEALKRHKEIETRLLEMEKAQREQDQEEKRQSNTGLDVPRKLPPNLEEYLQKRKSSLELYQTVPPSLKPFYKNLVEKYLRLVN